MRAGKFLSDDTFQCIGTRSDTVQEVFWLIGRIFADAEIFHDNHEEDNEEKEHQTEDKSAVDQQYKDCACKGQSRKLTVKGGAGIVSWGSSNTAVAGVSAGKVVAKGKGKATITVKKGTQKKSCQVTVETPELNKTAVEMDVEDTVSLDLKGCSHDVEWTSSDDDICEVEDGILIPYSSGTVTVKAKVHGMVWKCKVVITDSTEDDWNDDLDDDSDDDSENADDGYMDDEVDAAA